jgi:hypothetical protein
MEEYFNKLQEDFRDKLNKLHEDTHEFTVDEMKELLRWVEYESQAKLRQLEATISATSEKLVEAALVLVGEASNESIQEI